MDRRKFFKRIGIASLGVIAAPKIIKDAVQTISEDNFQAFHVGGRTFYLKKWPTKHGFILPKPRRAGSIFIPPTGVEPIIDELYKRYGKGKSYSQLLKSFGNG